MLASPFLLAVPVLVGKRGYTVSGGGLGRKGIRTFGSIDSWQQSFDFERVIIGLFGEEEGKLHCTRRLAYHLTNKFFHF